MTPFDLAARYTGIHEFPGKEDHPLIQWWLSLCELPITSPDETPWCSAFVNGICWELGLARSGKANARSWLDVGRVVPYGEEMRGNDIVILSRGDNIWQGHVGFFEGFSDDRSVVRILGGNQGDKVSLASFPAGRILGIRRV
jgi:uncharacterized protein (TIGR02594 family)